MKDRFEVIHKENHSAGLEKRVIYVDKETGVNYLYVQNGYSGGLTSLLDADGKPAASRKKDLLQAMSGHGRKPERSSAGINRVRMEKRKEN